MKFREITLEGIVAIFFYWGTSFTCVVLSRLNDRKTLEKHIDAEVESAESSKSFSRKEASPGD